MLINYNGESKVIKRICELLNSMSNINFEIVAQLPTQDISTSTIYLVQKSTAGQDNIYDEYINTDGTSQGWELIGDTEIDLSNYYTKAETDALIPDELSDLSDDSTHRLVTDTEKSTWNAKADISDIPTDFVPQSTGGTFNGSVRIEKSNSPGTTSIKSVLLVGNNKTEGTLNNSQGRLAVYGKGSNFFAIEENPSNLLTGDRLLYSPNKGGTLALVGDDVDWVSNGILGAKNLLPYPYAQTTQTINGVTVTDLGDGSLDFNNTSTQAGVKIILVANDATKAIPLKKVKYKFTWGNTTAPRMDFTLIKQDDTTETITGSSGYIDLDNTDGTYKGVYYIRLRTSATASFDHKVIYPMMRYATDSDETWQPYAMTNKELTDKKIGKWQDLGNWNTTSVGSSMSYSDKYDEFLIRIVGTTYSLDVHILNIAGVITGASGRIYRNYYQSDNQNYMAVNVGLTFGVDTIVFALETGTEEVINGSSQSIQQIRTFAR